MRKYVRRSSYHLMVEMLRSVSMRLNLGWCWQRSPGLFLQVKRKSWGQPLWLWLNSNIAMTVLHLQSAQRQQKQLQTWRKGSCAWNLAWFFPTVSSSLIKDNNSSSQPCLAHSLKTPELQQCDYNKGNESFIKASISARDLQKKKFCIFIYSCI